MLCIHLSFHILVVSTFWPLRVMLLQTFMYKVLYGHILLFLLGVYQPVELLGHMATLCLKVWGPARLSHSCCIILHPNQLLGSDFFHSLPMLVVICFFILVILPDLKWYFTVVLIYISLLTNGVEHLFMYTLAICISIIIFREMSIQNICPFLIG